MDKILADVENKLRSLFLYLIMRIAIVVENENTKQLQDLVTVRIVL